jgi:hypothetical protein
MRPRNALVALFALATSLAAGCESNEVETVGITFSFPGHQSDGFLAVGDRDTIRAQAYTKGYPSKLKYDSNLQPRRFGYHSGNPAVATVDANGIVVADTAGTAMIFASVEGVTSSPLTLHVSPVASELLATPSELTINIGDTAEITVTALDAAGAKVKGPLFAVTNDTMWWTTVSPLEWGRMQTPAVARFVAKSTGTARVRAYLMHEQLARQIDAKVQLTVVPP